MSRREQFGTLVQANFLTSSILLGGAAMGLRYCKQLNLDGTLARVWAVICGMLALPALIGLFAFPVLVLNEVFKPEGGDESSGLMILLWLGSCMFTGWNASLFIRSISLSGHIES